MKEVIVKARKTQALLPSKIIVGNIDVNGDKRIASEFNNFFMDIGPELAKGISRPARSFESYVRKSGSTMPTGLISVNELKDAFFSMGANKCPRHDETNFNKVRSCFGELCEPLQCLFDLSFGGCVSGRLGVGGIWGWCRCGLGGCGLISVLPCFSGVLGLVLCCRLWVGYAA